MSRCGYSGIQITASWMPVSYGNLPPNMVLAGPITAVARGRYGNDMVPGKVDLNLKRAFVPYDGDEKTVNEYEVLINTSLPRFGEGFQWRPASGGQVPPNALVGGHTESGEMLYVARTYINGDAVTGKVHPSHNTAYFPYGCKEHSMYNYEVLCFN